MLDWVLITKWMAVIGPITTLMGLYITWHVAYKKGYSDSKAETDRRLSQLESTMISVQSAIVAHNEDIHDLKQVDAAMGQKLDSVAEKVAHVVSGVDILNKNVGQLIAHLLPSGAQH